jgi:hypothetical protein
MATSLSVHYIKDIAFNQENLFLPDDSMLRIMRVTGIDKNGESNEITFFLTDDCNIQEVLT